MANFCIISSRIEYCFPTPIKNGIFFIIIYIIKSPIYIIIMYKLIHYNKKVFNSLYIYDVYTHLFLCVCVL